MASLINSAMPVAGRSAAQEYESLIRRVDSLRDAQHNEDARQRTRRGPLNVVVIGANLLAVAGQNGSGVEVGEILPLQAAYWDRAFARPLRTRR